MQRPRRACFRAQAGGSSSPHLRNFSACRARECSGKPRNCASEANLTHPLDLIGSLPAVALVAVAYGVVHDRRKGGKEKGKASGLSGDEGAGANAAAFPIMIQRVV